MPDALNSIHRKCIKVSLSPVQAGPSKCQFHPSSGTLWSGFVWSRYHNFLTKIMSPSINKPAPISSPSRNHVFKRTQLGEITNNNQNNNENNNLTKGDNTTTSPPPNPPPPMEISWRSTFLLTVIHIIGITGGIHLLTGYISVKMFCVQYGIGMMSALGTTAGAHRYWAHRSYSATLPLQLFLTLCQTISCQNSIYEWVRDHRVHHKFTETDADPHNAKRGFFFAHMGWLLVRKHPDVRIKGATVDMSDLERDPLVTWQRKYYIPLVVVFSFAIPTWILVALFGVSWFIAGANTMFRYILSLHLTWLVNSAAHLWGPKPYDGTINPSENVYVSFFGLGEGWHNYHHVFPWDYKTSELGLYRLNMTALFIDICAWMGLAYGRKTVPRAIVQSRMNRTGDGSQFRH